MVPGAISERPRSPKSTGLGCCPCLGGCMLCSCDPSSASTQTDLVSLLAAQVLGAWGSSLSGLAAQGFDKLRAQLSPDSFSPPLGETSCDNPLGDPVRQWKKAPRETNREAPKPRDSLLRNMLLRRLEARDILDLGPFCRRQGRPGPPLQQLPSTL